MTVESSTSLGKKLCQDNLDNHFQPYSQEFCDVLGSNPEFTKLIETDAHEGPVYLSNCDTLLFTTVAQSTNVPLPNCKTVAIKKLCLRDKKVSVLREASNMANGMTLDTQGHLLICEQGTKSTPARISRLESDLVTANSSHYVEGWKTGFQNADRPICTFTEGYLQGVIYGITGKAVTVTEVSCTNAGDECCKFEIDHHRTTGINFLEKKPVDFDQAKSIDYQNDSNIDEQKIIDALVSMPFIGNEDGLIPAFNVYLASTPADFYNLICIRFLKAMEQANLYSTAQELLLFAGEVCALNTLRGILIAPEWFELIAPMVKEEADCLYGLIAVTNALGWGNWHVLEYEPEVSLVLEAVKGYEACGYLEYRGQSDTAQCLMLTGVSTGIMELIHGEGTVEERIGTYASEETSCMCTGESSCVFEVEIL